MQTDVVLLPGLHGTTALFATFVAMAPPWARCRPMGLPVGLTQTPLALAGQLAPSLREFGGLVIVAESFSGPVAAHLSRLLSPRVSLLVLCNPLVSVSVRIAPKVLAGIVRSRWLPTWAAALALSGGRMALARQALEEVKRIPRARLEARLQASIAAAAGEIAENVSAPLLTILGSRDRLQSSSLTASALSGVPYSSTVVLDAPHLIVQSHPAEVWQAITEEFTQAA